MKKSIIFLLIVVLCILTACGNTEKSAASDIISPAATGEKPELTIQLNIPEYDYMNSNKAMIDYVQSFERQMGVKIEFDKWDYSIGTANLQDKNEFMKKLATKLYTNTGPDIILTDRFFFKEVIEQNAVKEVSGKIPNISKIYPGLLNDKTYYVPIGMMYRCMGLNGKLLQGLQITAPEYNWTRSGFLSLWDKCVSNENIYFDAIQYERVYARYVSSKMNFKIENDKLTIDIPKAAEGINQARQRIFNGNYKLNGNYTYENYYNMLFEKNSEEAAVSQKLYEANGDSEIWVSQVNGFSAKDIAFQRTENSIIAMPQFSDERANLTTIGLLVNKNSQHSELACEFINGLLSDEVQMALFNSNDYYYPVNKEIEEDIKKVEARIVKEPSAIKLKEYVLQQIKSSACDTEVDRDYRASDIYYMLFKDLSKYILADKPYSSDVLIKEIKAIVDKYNIWLSE